MSLFRIHLSYTYTFQFRFYVMPRHVCKPGRIAGPCGVSGSVTSRHPSHSRCPHHPSPRILPLRASRLSRIPAPSGRYRYTDKAVSSPSPESCIRFGSAPARVDASTIHYFIPSTANVHCGHHTTHSCLRSPENAWHVFQMDVSLLRLPMRLPMIIPMSPITEDDFIGRAPLCSRFGGVSWSGVGGGGL